MEIRNPKSEIQNHSEWIPVFRTGTHTDSSGNEKTWTEAELDLIVQKYQPHDHEAPAVIGHPEHNSPAWGWVEGLKRDGNILFAKFKGLVPEFVEMVRKGIFKKRSISLYPDMTLRHVGFLGAVPPAVKGLPDVAFGDKGGMTMIMDFGGEGSGNWGHEGRPGMVGGSGGGGGGITYKYRYQKVEDLVEEYRGGKHGDWSQASSEDIFNDILKKNPALAEELEKHNSEMDKLVQSQMDSPYVRDMQKLKHRQFCGKEAKRMKWFDWMKKKAADEGVVIEDAPQSFADGGNPKSEIPNPKLIEALVDAEVAKVVAAKNAEFAEQGSRLKAESERLKAESEKLEKAKGERRKDEIKSFCEGLCKDGGRLTPAMMKYGMGMDNFLEAISGIQTQYDFCEPQGSGCKPEPAQKLTPVEHIKGFLSSFKKQIEFGEFAGNEKDIPRGDDKREAAIKNYQEKNKKDGVEITYKEAVLAVSKDNPELFKQ